MFSLSSFCIISKSKVTQTKTPHLHLHTVIPHFQLIHSWFNLCSRAFIDCVKSNTVGILDAVKMRYYSYSLGRNMIIYCTKWVAIETLLFLPAGDGYRCMVPARFGFMVPTTIINKKYIQSVLWLRTHLASKLLESHGTDGKNRFNLDVSLINPQSPNFCILLFYLGLFSLWLVRAVLLANKRLIKL